MNLDENHHPGDLIDSLFIFWGKFCSQHFAALLLMLRKELA